MKSAAWVGLVLLGLLVGGWMTFDGVRRLWLGDYVRIDGQLGPWRHGFTTIGIDPMGTPVAILFLITGLARLLATAGLTVRCRWGWEATLLAGIASLWLLPVGTVTGVITILLLYVIGSAAAQ